MSIERTLSIVKPDGVGRNLIGEVYRRFEQVGLRVVAARIMQLSQAEAEGFYAVHRERPFFKDLVKFMTSGPVMVQVLEGEGAIAKNREVMGATDPKKAAPGTIRADLARSIEEHAGHGSGPPEGATVAVPEIVEEQRSTDGTRKWMLRMDRVQGIEMVYIPEPDRGTLCISSQVGCAMDCSFCSTAQQGFNRNLSVAEIVGQVWLAHRELAESRPRLGGGGGGDARANITNIVFMGMGEPLANYRNVVPAMRIFLDDLGYDLSRRRVTLSTSGLVPQIYKLAEECNVALAVSLHAPDDELRNQLVPINRIHPIAELLAACSPYIAPQNGPTGPFAYVWP